MSAQAQIPFGEIRAWMDDAIAFWAAHGVDREHGGFFEELSLTGEPTDCAFKRVRVMCRQTYAFSHAALLGDMQAAELSRWGYDYIAAKARLPGGGWARRLSREGAQIDATPDLYDISFVLFAFAWRYRVAKDADVLREMHATLDFLQRAMLDHANGGFWHKLPPEGPRLQNPHMHMTEACLASFEATQDQRFLDQARALVSLFRTKLFDGATLGERFSADWQRLTDERGRALEPGHHFEWAWILAQFQKATGDDLSRETNALVQFAERHGVDAASQAVFDEVRDDGVPLRTTSRTWTNTERIKGWLALSEITGVDVRPQIAGSVRLLFDRYFANVPRGAWIDQFDSEGRAMTNVVPASIVYHLYLAFSEVLRLERQLA